MQVTDYRVLSKLARGGIDQAGTGFGSAHVAAFEPPLMELARIGRLVIASTSVATNGRAPVQDVPTTTANWCLYNPATSTRYLVLLRAGYWLSGGTPAAGTTMIAGVTPGALASAVTSNATGHSVGYVRGSTDSGTGPFLGVNVTVPTMAANFLVIGGHDTPATASANFGKMFEVGGALIVPPSCGLAVDILSGAGTSPKFAISLLLASLELDVDG